MSEKIAPALAGRTVRCILFDLGSTLWMYKDDMTVLEAEQTAQQRAIAILHKHIAPHYFSNRDDATLGDRLTKAIGAQLYPTHSYSERELDFALVTIKALQQLGFPQVEHTLGAEIFEALRVRIPESRVLFEDVFSTLAALKKRDFLLGVVTNRSYGGKLFMEDLQTVGLLDYFEPRTIAISADLGIRKPAPQIFHYALDALHVPAEEAVMVGDSLGADIMGAKQLGIFAIWKPHPLWVARARTVLAQEHSNNPTAATLERILLNEARRHEEMRGRHLPDDFKPDLMIEHLSELLDIFVEAGKQP